MRAWRAGSASTSIACSPSPLPFGSGLAGLGGALGTEIVGLDPAFPLKFMIYFLIVVTVGGTSSITGPFLASLLLGIGDVAGKYYVPTLGAFVIYTIMIVVLIWRPQGLFTRGGATMSPRPLLAEVNRRLAARAALASAGGRLLDSGARLHLSPARPTSDPDRDRHPRRCSRSRST